MFIQVEPVRASVLDVLVCCVDMVLNTEWVQIEAIDLTSDGSAWGFGITGGRSTGVVVKTIVPGSVTDKDGRLQIGDHIIQIGDINLRGMGSEQVAMVLRQCGPQVHLIVARPIEPTTPEENLIQSASAIVPTRILNEPEELEQQLNVYQPGPNGFSDPMMQDMYSVEPNALVRKESVVYKRNERMDMESFEVNLVKDHQGLGIIVAGYVCEREDISGIFVKSIAKGSVADLCGQIRVHDQVVEVDGHPLKGYSNCEAVEILRNTGKYVKLQLARYNHGSKFDHLQEAMGSDKIHSSYDYTSASRKSISNPSVPDNHYTLSAINIEEIKAKWEKTLGPRSEIIVASLQKNDNEVGFGFNVETRRDDQSILHHFISDICKGYSVDRSEMLFIGDELLEVNGKQLRDTKYSEILTIFKSLPSNIILVCARSHHWASNLSLIPWSERLIKAKSDSYLALRKCHRSDHNMNRRSLEILSSLATWSSEPHFIDLVKGDDGLGFSIVEYKDNAVPNIQDENVIIVWSLVPGAAAQKDGRLLPGDRLLSVNNINFRHTNFEMAQQVLKHVPKGVVRLGIAKPITLSKSVPAKISFKEPLETQQEIIANGSNLKVFEYNGICHTYEEPLNMYGTRSQTPSSLFSFGNDSRCSTPFSSPGLSSSGKLWGFEIPVLPSALERIVKIRKGNNKLGLILDMVDRGQNGMIVKSIRPASAVEKDGTVQIGDYILGVNSENMRNITRSQARAIIRRAELTSSDIVIKYIPGGDAAVHQQSAVLAKMHEGNVSPTPSIISRQPSPRVFPAYYRSPYFSHKSTKSTPDRDDADGQISPFSFLSEDDVLATPSSLYTDNFDSSSDDLLLDQSSDGGMKEGGEKSEAFPSVEDRILLFQGTKHQVPSKFSRMSTSPTVSPVQDESPTQQKSPELPETPDSIPEVPIPNSNVSSPVVTSLGCQWGVNRTIELWRDPGQEIGIGVVMGCIDVQEEQDRTPLSGIFIKHIVPDSLAGREGTINRGDRIVAVNGIDLQNASYKEAIETIQNAENPIRLTVQSLVPWFPSATDSAAQSPVSKEDSTPLRSSQASFHAEKLKQRSMSEDEELEDTLDTDFQGKVYTSKGVEIDRNSAGYLKISDDSEEEDDFGYTNKKVQKKYGDLGTILLVEVEKGANGLGISLAGNKDRSKMSTFVCGLHPNGKAAKLEAFQVGDELLEVNGVVLFGRCHLNVSAVIRGMMTPTCKFVVLRRENSVEEMAVKPITHFPVDLENEKIEDLISSHPGVRTVTTKKGEHGLGIMILEGKHVELGRGIFISDLQKDSPAEKSGLCVGDMILAVNKTKLIGADYELAASVLKNEDGPMTFLVVNSQKPASSPVHNDIDHDKKPRNSLGILPDTDTRRKSSTPSSLCPTPSPNSSSPSPNLPACPIPPPAEFSDPCVTLDVVGKEMVVDIHREKNGLGLGIVGGSDTPIGCIVIHEIYANGAVAQDGRLKPGDQILEVNGHDLRHATHQEAINFLRHSVPNVQIRVYRHKETSESLSLAEFSVELYKKPGRGLGLTIVGKSNAPGVYISEVIKGGVADLEGSLMEGDQILEVNGQNLREYDQEAAAVFLKTCVGKINMKIGRLKCETNLPPRRSMH
ncbi:multiple PDZ domain protein-like [Argiope bruennichi]|uniref:multiple PDZ domain protein-like n=1 Tax=Argiope bruennichi TaxID=94029 RepID=UPI00249528F3|nr:multiple PDZ domain protein-like [Argiope bruennichi]